MTAPHSSAKPLRMIGLTRKSKGEDEGTHTDQRRIIEDRCVREGFTLVRVDSEKGTVIYGWDGWIDVARLGAIVVFGLLMWRIAIHAMTRKLVD